MKLAKIKSIQANSFWKYAIFTDAYFLCRNNSSGNLQHHKYDKEHWLVRQYETR